jgi:alkanesulfonate monooxygenase SsuD/methylene tetrahydromethanopterin reductase-like flavin-dependent oxidoreductase (luciferase family)
MQDFCVGTLPRIANTEIVKLTEELGFSHHGVADGPLLVSDPFVYLGAAVRETSTINLGTYVVNPLTRIPAVVANALATLNGLAPGRVFAGIGAANNATLSMGVRMGRVKEVEDAVHQIRALTTGGRIANEWLGKTKDIEFIASEEQGWLNTSDRIPIWQAAGGPKSLRAAARNADVVIYVTGSDPSMVRLIRRIIDEECESVGRDPGEVKLVGLSWFTLRRPGDTIEDAMRDGFGNGAVISGHTNNAIAEAYADELPEEIVKFCKDSWDSYQPQEGDKEMDHIEVYRTHVSGAIAQRHIDMTTEEATKYWCLWGDYDEVAERVQGMRDAGVDIPSVVLGNPFNYERDARDLAKALSE